MSSFLKVKDFLGMLIRAQAASRPHCKYVEWSVHSPHLSRKLEQICPRALNAGRVSPAGSFFHSVPCPPIMDALNECLRDVCQVPGTVLSDREPHLWRP